MKIRVIVDTSKDVELANIIHNTEDIYKFDSMDSAYRHFFKMCVYACGNCDEDDIKTDVTLWDEDNKLLEYFTIDINGISNNLK